MAVNTPKPEKDNKTGNTRTEKNAENKKKFLEKMKKATTTWKCIDKTYDWKKEYNSVFRRWTEHASHVTEMVFTEMGLSSFHNDNPGLEMVSGLYLVWGYKGSGKTTRLSMGLPLEGDEAREPLVSKLGHTTEMEGKVYLFPMSEPDYPTDLLFAAELTSLIRLMSAKRDVVIVIDSLSAVLNYQAKHCAAEGEEYSGELVSLADRYTQQPFDLMATNAAGAGGVPGSLGHLLRILQNIAKTQNIILLGLMNPLKIGETQSEASLIKEINSITNGVLPLDACVVSEDVRMYNNQKRIAARVSFSPEHVTETITLENPLDTKYKL